MWEFWRRHKRKVYVTLGVVGSGYLVYKLYDSLKRSLTDFEKQHAEERKTEELIKSQIQAHFESVQRTADATFPHVIRILDRQLSESLDLDHLMQRLLQAKDQPNTLTTVQKVELWSRLNILCFTKLVSSLWSMTILSLFIRVQVNILGRHLYIDTARGLGSQNHLDEPQIIDEKDEQQFLACADYLSNRSLPSLISDAELATTEILKGKDLKVFFNDTLLCDTIIHIMHILMITKSPHHWISYLMPEHAGSSSSMNVSQTGKFEILIGESRSVLSSAEFGDILDLSLRRLVEGVLEDLMAQCGENFVKSGIPLARLIPRLVHMGRLLLTEPYALRYMDTLKSIPEVEVFFTVLYSTTPT